MDTWSSAKDLWQRLIIADLELVWDARNYGIRTPPLRGLLPKIVNAQPLRDISLATWCICIAYLPELGLPLFYACTANLLAASALRVVVRARRPFEYDERLKPLADRYEGSHGFPSLESYMCVVIYGLIYAYQPSLVMGVLLSLLGLFIGYTRVYAASRFTHQIVGSWVLGLMGLHITESLMEVMQRHRASATTHAAMIVGTAMAFAGYIAYHAEMNESYLLRLPKEEYVRVLREILDQDHVANGAAGIDGYEEDPTAVSPFVRSAAREGSQPRRDSFYFLEQIVARRKAEQAAARASDLPKNIRWAEEVYVMDQGTMAAHKML